MKKMAMSEAASIPPMTAVPSTRRATAPAPAVADPAPPTVVPGPSVAPPVACEATTEGGVQTESKIDSPADMAPASLTTRPLTIAPEPVTVAEDVKTPPQVKF